MRVVLNETRSALVGSVNRGSPLQVRIFDLVTNAKYILAFSSDIFGLQNPSPAMIPLVDQSEFDSPVEGVHDFHFIFHLSRRQLVPSAKSHEFYSMIDHRIQLSSPDGWNGTPQRQLQEHSFITSTWVTAPHRSSDNWSLLDCTMIQKPYTACLSRLR